MTEAGLNRAMLQGQEPAKALRNLLQLNAGKPLRRSARDVRSRKSLGMGNIMGDRRRSQASAICVRLA